MAHTAFSSRHCVLGHAKTTFDGSPRKCMLALAVWLILTRQRSLSIAGNPIPSKVSQPEGSGFCFRGEIALKGALRSSSPFRSLHPQAGNRLGECWRTARRFNGRSFGLVLAVWRTLAPWRALPAGKPTLSFPKPASAMVSWSVQRCCQRFFLSQSTLVCSFASQARCRRTRTLMLLWLPAKNRLSLR